MRSLRVREYKLERDESTTSFLIFLSHHLWDLAPDDPLHCSYGGRALPTKLCRMASILARESVLCYSPCALYDIYLHSPRLGDDPSTYDKRHEHVAP